MRILFDIKQMKVGCPLLQIAFGGSAGICRDFPSETWFISPTEDMKLYGVTDRELSILLHMTLRQHVSKEDAFASSYGVVEWEGH